MFKLILFVSGAFVSLSNGSKVDQILEVICRESPFVGHLQSNRDLSNSIKESREGDEIDFATLDELAADVRLVASRGPFNKYLA